MRWPLALVVCVVLVLGGCGGSDTTTSSVTDSETTPTTAQSEAKSATTPDHGQRKSKQDKKGSSHQGGDSSTKGAKGSKDNSSSPKRYLAKVKAPAISSRPTPGSKAPAPGVKTVKGGDNSVQEYGVESGSPERTEASIALQGYLNARARQDWSTACSLLAKKPTQQLEKLAGGKADCAEVLGATAKGAPSMPGSVITEALSLRGEGDISGNPSYLIFTGPPGATLFSMPMYLEGQTWKVGLAQPSELPV